MTAISTNASLREKMNVSLCTTCKYIRKCFYKYANVLVTFWINSRDPSLVVHWSFCSRSSAEEEAVFVPQLKGPRCWWCLHRLAYPLQVPLIRQEECSVQSATYQRVVTQECHWHLECHPGHHFHQEIGKYRIYSIRHPGYLLKFWTLRVGAYSR